MALFKETRQEDGVPTNYHRVLYVVLMTNSHNSVAVTSYVDGDARAQERDGALSAPPYSHSRTYEMPYDPTMTVETAYNYLKTLPDFEGATDI